MTSTSKMHSHMPLSAQNLQQCAGPALGLGYMPDITNDIVQRRPMINLMKKNNLKKNCL